MSGAPLQGHNEKSFEKEEEVEDSYAIL